MFRLGLVDTLVTHANIKGFGLMYSAVDSRGAGGARAPPEFGDLEKGQSLISAYRSLAITMNTPGFKKLSTALYSIKAVLKVR
jgi:hypothetical protein